MLRSSDNPLGRSDSARRSSAMERLFKAVYFAGLVAETILRFPYERDRRRIPKTDQRVSRTERSLLAGLSFAGLVLPLIYSVTGWLDFANYHLSRATKVRLGSIGTLVMAAAVWLFWRSHRDLGANWSPSLEIGAQQTLTTQGVYRTVRHPMYASGWLLALAQCLLLHNWIAGFGSLLAFLPLYVTRVPREE